MTHHTHAAHSSANATANEPYGFNWPGKHHARQLAQTPSTATLRPCKTQSVDWGSTRHLVIEGDNLDVLKLLQKSYAAKVKLIYIDPPCSADWLNMMYPRLVLARELLREDGVVFMSVDDPQVSHLRQMGDEVFGQENFIANVVWQKKYAPTRDTRYFGDMHAHILVFAKVAKRTKNDPRGWHLDWLTRTDSLNKAYKNPDHDPRGAWRATDLTVKTAAAKNDFSITTPSGRVVNSPRNRCWAVSPAHYFELVADNRIWFGAKGGNIPALKTFLHEAQDGTVPGTWWTYQDCGHNQGAKKELKALFSANHTGPVFDAPKPVQLIARMLQLATKSDPQALVLDIFAGSGTTGQAVYEMNALDAGKRRFILVQLPEAIQDSAQSVADFAQERLRRSAIKIRASQARPAGFKAQISLNLNGEAIATPPDLGFRVFKLAHANRHTVYNRTEADTVAELLLQHGLDLCAPVASRTIAGKTVGAVAGGKLMTCLAEHLGTDEIAALALGLTAWHKELAPEGATTCFFKSSAFESEAAKAHLTAALAPCGSVRFVQSALSSGLD